MPITPLSPINLINTARQASQRSYSPYSQFPVGAAIELHDGTVITGTNVENESYGLTMCAERAALFTAVNQVGVDANGRLPATQIAVWAKKGQPEGAVTPCGACRQVMNELLPKHTPVWMIGSDGEPFSKTVEELLPASFSLNA